MQNYQGNTRVGLISGIAGGLGKYFLQINTPVILNVMGAIFLAFICGIAGVAGKEVYFLTRNYIKKHKSNGRIK